MLSKARIEEIKRVLSADPTADGGEAYLQWQRDLNDFNPANKGEWQERYVREYFETLLDEWVTAVEVRDLHVLDFGAGMGSNLSAMIDGGADAWGCEVLPVYVQRSPFQNIRGRLLLADVCDMWMFADDIFDVLHSGQVLEHLRPDVVDRALVELFRVAAPGARLLCSFCCDTASDDPTHFTVESEGWWDDRAEAAGWDVLPELRERYRNSPMARELYPYWGILALGKSDY